MTSTRPSRRPQVLASALVVLLLAGSLTLRLAAKEPTTTAPSPSSPIKEPIAIELSDLEPPCWSCPNIQDWSIAFKTDLDTLAPLGDGSSNVAVWLAELSGSPRLEKAMQGRFQTDDLGSILPPDHPLLEEAEAWTEQASLDVYPEIFPLQGYETELLPLRVPLVLSRSWVYRGRNAQSDVQALEDYRRAIRFGRLMRQDGAVIINDLIGLACIHAGTRAIYDLAIASGDLKLALVASIVIGEVAPQRMRTIDMISKVDLGQIFRAAAEGGQRVAIPEYRLQAILEVIDLDSDRRFRAEALLSLHQAAGWADEATASIARAKIEAIHDGDDEILAEIAAWSIANPVTVADMPGFYNQSQE